MYHFSLGERSTNKKFLKTIDNSGQLENASCSNVINALNVSPPPKKVCCELFSK